MKRRSDFVSNSSSSSFIVITNSGNYENPWKNQTMWDPIEIPFEYEGFKEFGWQTEKYYDVYSKLNWAALVVIRKQELEDGETSEARLAEEVKKPWYRAQAMEELLKKVCKEEFDIDVELRRDTDGYIDHQSNIGESPENARMFETSDMLCDFLANDNSYIDNSNDNGGRDDEWDEELEGIPPPPKDYSI